MNFDLNQRQQKVLFATIAQYVETGQPVSSGSISSGISIGLSPASIRRIMNELTVSGLLIQPHTSAGRIPTDHGFRLFVNALRETASQLDAETQDTLSCGLNDLVVGEATSWKKMVGLLSEVSKQAALVITPAFSDSVLRQIHFVPLESLKLLAVVVTREGLVHNCYLTLTEPLNSSELEKIHNYLSQTIGGRSLNDVRSVLRDEIRLAQNSCDVLRKKAAQLGAEAVDSSVIAESQLVVEGRGKLIEKPELDGRLRQLMNALEQKSSILALLDMAADTDKGPLVIIGEEGGENFEGCALVSAPFSKNGLEGQIGIVGPTRMNYQTMLPLVSLSAEIISSTLKDEE